MQRARVQGKEVQQRLFKKIFKMKLYLRRMDHSCTAIDAVSPLRQVNSRIPKDSRASKSECILGGDNYKDRPTHQIKKRKRNER
jgi:hypothetical protein